MGRGIVPFGFAIAIEAETEASGELSQTGHKRFGAVVGGRRCAAQQFARTVFVLLLKLMDLLLLLFAFLWKLNRSVVQMNISNLFSVIWHWLLSAYPRHRRVPAIISHSP